MTNDANTYDRNAAEQGGAGLHARSFGAVGDGISDDTQALQKAMDSLRHGDALHISGGIYNCDNIAIPSGVTIKGYGGSASDMANPFPDFYSYGSQIRLRNLSSISMAPGSAIEGVTVVRDGLPISATMALYKQARSDASLISAAQAAGIEMTKNFRGVAIYANQPCVTVKDCLILGNEQAVRLTSEKTSNLIGGRCLISNVRGDNTNGIFMENCADVCRIKDCHMWPFLTGTCPGPTDAQNTDGNFLNRHGVAYYIGHRNDWTQLSGCFSYGYRKGFHLHGCANITLNDCKADGNGFEYKSSGFHINDLAFQAAELISLCNCCSFSNDHGVYIESGGTSKQNVVKVIGGTWVANTGIHVVKGRCIAIGNHFLLGHGIYFRETATGGIVEGNIFTESEHYVHPNARVVFANCQ
ncbi:MAG: hypothetical protein RLZZ326_2818 [Planctomycetota bacterium]|jgi:hypothetical protein